MTPTPITEPRPRFVDLDKVLTAIREEASALGAAEREAARSGLGGHPSSPVTARGARAVAAFIESRPNTREQAERFAAEHRRLPDYPAIVRRRIVTEWETP